MEKKKNKYNIFHKFCKDIRRLDNYDDVLQCLNIYINSNKIVVCPKNIEYNLIKSVLNPELYVNKIDEIEFFVYIKLLEGLKYRDDAQPIMDEIVKITDDKAQINTLYRLIKRKPYNSDNLNKSRNDDYFVVKNCPHCGNEYKGYTNQEYVICGYTSQGFDWFGCGYDWCFQCSKRLCKCWDSDQLFNRENRYHNNKCCKINAYKMGYNYTSEYCHCHRNRYVRR